MTKPTKASLIQKSQCRASADSSRHPIGRHTEALVQALLESRPHPEQGYRSCLGILRLAKQTLRLTPAMEAGVTDHVFSVAKIVGAARLADME